MLTSLVSFMRRHGILQPKARPSLPGRPDGSRNRSRLSPSGAPVGMGNDHSMRQVEKMGCQGRLAEDVGSERQRGEDRQKGIERGEPAMHGIPGDAVQMMPRAASPGLPPVDPVEARSAERPNEAAAAVAAMVPEVPALTAATESGGPGQGISPIKSCQNVASTEADDMRANPWRTASEVSAREHVPPLEEAGAKSLPREDGGADAAALSHVTSVTCEHSCEGAAKDRQSGSWSESRTAAIDAAGVAADQAEPPSEPLDSGSKAGSPHAGGAPSSRRRPPPRIAARPRVEEWADDELLTLPEAAALFWPAGPITTNTLRTAGRDGTLAITKVAGKFFTTPMAIRRMGHDEAGHAPAQEPATPTVGTPRALFEAKLEEARRLGRDRKRRQRAAKRSVAPLDTGAGR